jgi:hypothetical protein
MVQEIPSILSLALGALLVLLTVEYLSFARRSTLVYLLVVAFSTLVFHTAGIIITILFCAGLFAVYLIGLGRPGYIKTRRIRTLLAALCLMSLTYWTFTGNLLSFLLNPLRNLVKIVVSSPTVSSSSYTAPYSGQGFEIFSYAWALPVGISAAYFLLVGYKYFKNGKHSFAKKNSSHILPFVAATCGLILLLISFVFVVNSGGGATERWLDATNPCGICLRATHKVQPAHRVLMHCFLAECWTFRWLSRTRLGAIRKFNIQSCTLNLHWLCRSKYHDRFCGKQFHTIPR